MLDPRKRQLLLESLRPPEGYRLDFTVGTSFTLDLITLLTAPLAFTLLEWEEEDGQFTSDTVKLLESVRRHAERIRVFCQAGEVKVPPPTHRLVAYLEQCIIEARAPHPEGIFHPKIWLLRYTSSPGNIVYRFLCLSRNLTFDRCWDTILTLNGKLTSRSNAIATNHPLGDFIQALPAMAKTRLPDNDLERINQMSEEVRRVRFELPEGFDELSFIPLGIDQRRPFLSKEKRPLLIVSPFVSATQLKKVTAGRSLCTLISRPEQLASLPGEAIAGFSRIYVMDQQAEDIAPDEPAEQGVALSGLHAKLFIEEEGWNAHVFTGSANATEAAFTRNVEFLTRLSGRKSRVGMDQFLSDEPEGSGFMKLLRPWTAENAVPSDELQARDELERSLAMAGYELARQTLAIHCLPADENLYALELRAQRDLPDFSSVNLKCWPSSIKAEMAVSPSRGPGTVASFSAMSLDAVNAFMAFEMSATRGEVSVAKRFVLCLPLEGAPPDRLERLLASQLKDSSRLLQLIWLLLHEAIEATMDSDEAGRFASGWISAAGSIDGFPVFEKLVRALADSPGKIRDVGRLLEDLSRSPEGTLIIPKGLTELWNVMKQCMEESRVAPGSR